MLKIKEEVNLEELEKFGFEKVFDFWRYFYTEYDVIIIDETREIDIEFEIPYINLQEYNDKLYELIMAGLVEKVD